MIFLVLVFAKLFYIVSAQDGNFPALELNVTVSNSSTMLYPERILIQPSNNSSGKPRLHLIYAEDHAPSDNRLKEEYEEDEVWGMQSVLSVAALQYAALLNYSIDNLGHMANTPVSQMLLGGPVEPEVDVSYVRKRRSTEELRPLVRKKRTHHKHGCMICQMLQPSRAITINIVKQQPSGCSTCQQQQQPPPCGHPQSPCGHPQPPPVYHPPPPPPVYHPPPPPPQPVYHPPQPQQCHPCPPPSCNPCSHPGGNYGSYTQSSAASQSSSAGWGKK